MTLKMIDVGPINEAQIDIGKINIVTGPNASGKTTSSKILYSLVTSISNNILIVAEQIKSEIENVFAIIFPQLNTEQKNTIKNDFIIRMDKYFEDLNELKKIFSDFTIFLEYTDFSQQKKPSNNDEIEVRKILNQIDELFISSNDEDYILPALKLLLLRENSFLYSSIKSKVGIFGVADANTFELKLLKENENINIECSDNILECFPINDVIYFETPFTFDIIDFVRKSEFISNFNIHHDILIDKLIDDDSTEDIFDDKFDEDISLVCNEVDNILGGDIYLNKDNDTFYFKQNDRTLLMRDVSNGIKQIGMINLLLKNRKISKNSLLIMDEPEIHLHPEWQLKLAEIIVILAKKADLTFYINTHSPQFVEAVEAYSKYHDLEENTNFYSTVFNNEIGKYDFKKIGNDNIKEIYSHLGNIYEKIDEIKAKNDARDFLDED